MKVYLLRPIREDVTMETGVGDGGALGDVEVVDDAAIWVWRRGTSVLYTEKENIRISILNNLARKCCATYSHFMNLHILDDILFY